MFGFGGLSEVVFILFIALLIFGPEKLPEIGRLLAKGMAEVRKASNELKRTLNAEIAVSEQEKAARRIADAPPPPPIPAPAPWSGGETVPNLDVPGAYGGVPAPATPAPSVETQDPWLETQPPPVEAQPPAMDTQPPRMEAQPPRMEAQPPPMDTQPPPMDTQPPPMEAQPPPMEAQPPPVEVPEPVAPAPAATSVAAGEPPALLDPYPDASRPDVP